MYTQYLHLIATLRIGTVTCVKPMFMQDLFFAIVLSLYVILLFSSGYEELKKKFQF